MTRLLILGGGGMLGHELWQAALPRIETKATVRSDGHFFVERGYPRGTVLPHFDVSDKDAVVRAFAAAKPDVVVNCIGVVKQLAASKDALRVIALNSLLPHQLADLCDAASARLIHISTDCVFSGRKGMYLEGDFSDAEDLYGKSKFLGEVNRLPSSSVRTRGHVSGWRPPGSEGRARFASNLRSGSLDFVHMERRAFCVLSDSGTVQEECALFGVPERHAARCDRTPGNHRVREKRARGGRARTCRGMRARGCRPPGRLDATARVHESERQRDRNSNRVRALWVLAVRASSALRCFQRRAVPAA